MSFWSRIGNVLRGERLSREIDEEFEAHIQEAIAMGHQLAEMAPLVLGTLKRFVNDMILTTGPIERMVETSIAIARVRGSEDLKEGVAAYKEKRKPRFTGR